MVKLLNCVSENYYSTATTKRNDLTKESNEQKGNLGLSEPVRKEAVHAFPTISAPIPPALGPRP